MFAKVLTLRIEPQLLDQRPVDPVDRRHPTEVEVVLRHVVEPLRRYVAPAGDVLQERADLLGAFRPAE